MQTDLLWISACYPRKIKITVTTARRILMLVVVFVVVAAHLQQEAQRQSGRKTQQT